MVESSTEKTEQEWRKEYETFCNKQRFLNGINNGTEPVDTKEVLTKKAGRITLTCNPKRKCAQCQRWDSEKGRCRYISINCTNSYTRPDFLQKEEVKEVVHA